MANILTFFENKITSQDNNKILVKKGKSNIKYLDKLLRLLYKTDKTISKRDIGSYYSIFSDNTVLEIIGHFVKDIPENEIYYKKLAYEFRLFKEYNLLDNLKNTSNKRFSIINDIPVVVDEKLYDGNYTLLIYYLMDS